jgi:transcriptional regulator with XRE-family HTH domain|nr:MAG: hypothetical protein KatS3mg041_1864 [Bacteroidota bacterium]
MEGVSLRADLQAIRAVRGITLQQLAERFYIGIDVLEDLEGGDLSRRRFSTAHQRALYRTYAQALDIDPDHLWQAVQAHQAGLYCGSLGHRYLGRRVSEEELALEARALQAPKDEAQQPVRVVHVGLASSRMRLGNWLAVLMAAGVLTLLGISLHRLWNQWARDRYAERLLLLGSQAPLLRGTTSEPRYVEEQQVVLPDTLFFTLEALSGPLDPIRVRTDDHVSVRYWLEPGERRTFWARDSFALQGPVSRLRLWILNQPYPQLADTLDYRWVRFSRPQLMQWLRYERSVDTLAYAGGSARGN